jgi:hypothetical protein
MEGGYLWSDPETETFSVVVKRNISDPNAGRQKITHKRILKIFCSLFSWSLRIFKENQSPKKYIAKDIIIFMLIKSQGVEILSYCYT